MTDTFRRFLGGSPAAVLLKLIMLSFVVGVVLSALGLSPADLLESIVRLVHRIWAMGFSAIDWAIKYFLLGAVVVVPIWVVVRLLRVAQRRP